MWERYYHPTLAQNSPAHIIALDNEKNYLLALAQQLASLTIRHQVSLCCASMMTLPFSNKHFNVIWAENCAYIIGFEHALHKWRPYLSENGYLVISELVWFTETPSATAQQFWQINYPAMRSIKQNQYLIKKAGYQLVNTFRLSHSAWDNYLSPLKTQLDLLKSTMSHTTAWLDLQKEIAIHDHYLDEYGYQFFIMKKRKE